MNEEALTRLHYELVRGLVEDGVCPSNSTLALRLGVEEVEGLMRGLSDIHGVVLHPHVCEPWVLHPFSLTPTLNWGEGETKNWWVPCVWCALGVAMGEPVPLRQVMNLARVWYGSHASPTWRKWCVAVGVLGVAVAGGEVLILESRSGKLVN